MTRFSKKLVAISSVFLLALVFGAALVLFGCEENVDELPSESVMVVESEWVPGQTDAATLAQQRLDLQQWLVSERVAIEGQAPIAAAMSKAEIVDLAKASVKERPYPRPELIGVNVPISVGVDFADLSFEDLGDKPVARERGALKRIGADGFVWTAQVASQGAKALKVHFDDFSLPAKMELYVYNNEGLAFGPYTETGPDGSGDFWSNTVKGSTAYLQLRYVGKTPASALAATWFKISQIAHIDPSAMRQALKGSDTQSTPDGFCSFTAECVVDARCADDTDWGFIDEARMGVAHYTFVSGAWIYMCSGGLIADTDTDTEVPYFLTANHCLSKKNEAKTLEAYFQFWTDTCQGQCYDADGAITPVSGAAVVASNKSSDYTLLRLNEVPPVDSVYFGWTNEAVSNTEGSDLYRVSHPQGAPQSFSKHLVDTTTGTCTSWPRGEWIYSADVIGATQGGSSGSPVLNADGLVVGQLSGACGTNLEDDCDSVNNATVDGALAAYYSQVAEFLAPSGGGSCEDADGDGFGDESCGGDDCDDSNASVNPDAPEVCDDGIDNNCDGSVDEGCGGDCVEGGGACAVDEDCCNLRCKKGTCRG